MVVIILIIFHFDLNINKELNQIKNIFVYNYTLSKNGQNFIIRRTK